VLPDALDCTFGNYRSEGGLNFENYNFMIDLAEKKVIFTSGMISFSLDGIQTLKSLKALHFWVQQLKTQGSSGEEVHRQKMFGRSSQVE